MAQFEPETSYDSSEPNSITNSSTQEGEHTIHGDEEDEDENEDIGEIAVDEVVEKLQSVAAEQLLQQQQEQQEQQQQQQLLQEQQQQQEQEHLLKEEEEDERTLTTPTNEEPASSSAFPEVVGNLEQEMVIQRELETAANQQRAADEEEIHQLRKKLEEVRRHFLIPPQYAVVFGKLPSTLIIDQDGLDSFIAVAPFSRRMIMGHGPYQSGKVHKTVLIISFFPYTRYSALHKFSRLHVAIPLLCTRSVTEMLDHWAHVQRSGLFLFPLIFARRPKAKTWSSSPR